MSHHWAALALSDIKEALDEDGFQAVKQHLDNAIASLANYRQGIETEPYECSCTCDHCRGPAFRLPERT